MSNELKARDEMELMRRELWKASSLERHFRKYAFQDGDEKALAKSYSRVYLFLEHLHEEYAAYLLALFAGGGISSYLEGANFYKEVYARSRQQKSSFADTSLKGLIESGDKLAAIFDLFFSDNLYEPPDHPEEIRLHLLALYAFYRHLCPADPPALLILRLSYVAAKVAWAVAAAMGVYTGRGATKDRVTKGATAKKSKKDENKKPVIDEFKAMDTRGMSKHKIAKRLQARLGKKMKDPPSVDTIKRYLKEDGLI